MRHFIGLLLSCWAFPVMAGLPAGGETTPGAGMQFRPGTEQGFTAQPNGTGMTPGHPFPQSHPGTIQSITAQPECLYIRHLPDTAIKSPEQPTDPVAEAEYAFARHAVDSGVKAAFLRYMDTSSVIFNNGRVTNGMRYWEKAKEPAATLYWQPVFACTAADGQSGFTTGPFEWRRTTADSALSCGQYTTVWQKDENGDWHFFADLGIGYHGSLFNKKPLRLYTPHLPSPNHATAIAIDSNFIALFRREPTDAFKQVLLPETWLNFNGQHPVQTTAGIMATLQQIPAGLDFEPLAGFVADSRDLAYVYGHTLLAGKKENYLRVWAYTNAGWKLLLQVLRW